LSYPPSSANQSAISGSASERSCVEVIGLSTSAGAAIATKICVAAPAAAMASALHSGFQSNAAIQLRQTSLAASVKLDGTASRFLATGPAMHSLSPSRFGFQVKKSRGMSPSYGRGAAVALLVGAASDDPTWQTSTVPVKISDPVSVICIGSLVIKLAKPEPLTISLQATPVESPPSGDNAPAETAVDEKPAIEYRVQLPPAPEGTAGSPEPHAGGGMRPMSARPVVPPVVVGGRVDIHHPVPWPRPRPPHVPQ
ncbi:hypothetical protein KFL_001650010, partial [Klebsormidium nitens]